MSTFWLVLLGMVSGAGAGLLAGLIGIGGGIVIVPVVFYGLVETGTSADQAAHVAVRRCRKATEFALYEPGKPMGARAAHCSAAFGLWRQTSRRALVLSTPAEC